MDGHGRHIRVSGPHVSGVDPADAAAWQQFHGETARHAAVLARAFRRRAPRLLNRDARDTLALLGLGWDLKRLGRAHMRELLRIGLMNIHDLASERFTDDLLRATLAADAVLGTAMGPRSPNTVMSYLYRRAGEALGSAAFALPAGGMGAVADALAAEARARGVRVDTGRRVARILEADGRATGVELADGERIAAPVVVSNADPRSTLRGLLGYPALDAGFVRRIEGIRMRGTAAKLHLALEDLPELVGLPPEAYGQRLLLCGTLDGLELAFNPVKYRECSRHPLMEITIPTLHDPTLAPAGQHVLSAIVQYAPAAAATPTEALREEFLQRALAQLERVVPDIRRRVLASELLLPADLEREFGMEGGHWHHGEIAVDQLLMLRPVPLAAQYAMPVDGLYLCGAGTHPGGFVNGLPGWLCADEVLRREARP
jgi:phytoene dehydrogenase-like protein